MPTAAWLSEQSCHIYKLSCTAEAPAAQLGLLLAPLQALLVPRLRLADVQRLGQTCRAARALVDSLPDATLRQLAQARATWLPTPRAACMHG